MLAHPSPSKTFKLIYSGGYVLTESLNAIISYEKNEFGLEFYLSSPSAAEKGQRVLVGITNSEDLRNGKLNFVIESMSGKQHSHHDPTTVSTTCHQSHQSPALRHLVRTCMGLAILRELSEDERNQIEAFKKASRGKSSFSLNLFWFCVKDPKEFQTNLTIFCAFHSKLLNQKRRQIKSLKWCTMQDKRWPCQLISTSSWFRLAD